MIDYIQGFVSKNWTAALGIALAKSILPLPRYIESEIIGFHAL
jgi:hypothetical protein